MDKNMNEFLGSLHETAVGLHKIGVISDAEMREYDQNCIIRDDETIPGATRNLPVTPVFAHPSK
jgi:DNA-binding transcriptional regulator YiaG